MTDAPESPTVAALERTSWREMDRQNVTYHEFWAGFGELARDASEREDLEAAAACRLLAGVASLLPADDQLHDPYGPMARISGKRTFLPDDMTKHDLEFLAELAPQLASPRLAARCFDLLWIAKHQPKPHEYGQLAVTNWLRLGVTVDDDDWYIDIFENWPRYLTVARQLRMQVALQEAYDLLVAAFWDAGPRRSLDLAELLRDTGMVKRETWIEIAGHFAVAASERQEGTVSRELAVYAAHLYKQLGDEAAFAAAQYQVVDWWLTEAERRLEQSALSAVSLFQAALQNLRQLSRRQRDQLGIGDLADSIAVRIRESGISALDEMRLVEGEGFDITAEVEQVQAAVTGQSAAQATLLLVAAVPYLAESSERRAAEERLENAVMLNLISTQHFAEDGRVVHNTDPEGPAPWDGYPAKVWGEMLRNFDDLHVQWVVKSRIMPALEVITSEHRIRTRDCVVVARCSPIVPVGREKTVARALAAGFNYDFTAALYMLVPQIENIVRVVLNEAGISTTTIDDRVEQEIGLSSLLKIPELSRILGEDIVFELRALFGGPTGANMRNTVAHGLLSDDGALGDHAIYAWWFLLRLVYIPYWNGLMKEVADHDGDGEGEGEY